MSTHLSFADRLFSFPSLPDSEVALEGLPLVPPFPPLRMIFIAGIVGGGVFPEVGGFEILVNDCSNLQKELQGGRSMYGSFESLTNVIRSCSRRSKKIRSFGESNASRSFSSGV